MFEKGWGAIVIGVLETPRRSIGRLAGVFTREGNCLSRAFVGDSLQLRFAGAWCGGRAARASTYDGSIACGAGFSVMAD